MGESLERRESGAELVRAREKERGSGGRNKKLLRIYGKFIKQALS